MDKIDRRDGKVTSLFQSPAQKQFLKEDDAQQQVFVEREVSSVR
jgi:hypothetical protein